MWHSQRDHDNTLCFVEINVGGKDRLRIRYMTRVDANVYNNILV